MAIYTIETVRLHRPGDFSPRRPIIAGKALDGVTHKSGVKDLAATQVALMANLGHPIVQASPNITLTLSTAAYEYELAKYKFPIPAYLNATESTGRGFLRVCVTGKVSAGTWSFRGKTSTASDTGTGGTTTTSTLTADIPLRPTITGVVFDNPSTTLVRGTKTAHGFFTGDIVRVSGCTQAYANALWVVQRTASNTFTLVGADWTNFTGADVTGNVRREDALDDTLVIAVALSNNNADFSFYTVAAWILPSSGTVDGGEIYSEDNIVPVSVADEFPVDGPLTVAATRNLVQANDTMWRHNVRPIVNFCYIETWASIQYAGGYPATGTTPEIKLENNEIAGRKKTWEFIYFPRPGVTRLKVYWDGAYTTAVCDCMIGFKGQGSDVAWGEFTVSHDYYFADEWDSGGASPWGTLTIPVPEGAGPFFLELRAKQDYSTGVANIAALSIYELGIGEV